MAMNLPATLRRLASIAACIAFSSAVAACDPPPAEDLLLGPKAKTSFAVEDAGAAREPVPADGSLRLRFTEDVDPRSVGPRSVRVTRAGGRRPVRVHVWTRGAELRISASPGRVLPAGETLVLRLEGAPSPRSVRSTAGEPLPASYEMRFEVGPARGDLVGPRLVDALPRDGAQDAAPGSSVELRFSEPIATGSVTAGDAVALSVDGRTAPARLQLSGDRTTIVVRPESPLPPDRTVIVTIQPCILDVAGNPLEPGSPRSIAFRTRTTSLHELCEDFADSSTADARATSCGWDDPESPGVLVARGGAVLVGPEPGEAPLDLGDAVSLRFQLLLSGTEVPTGLASALRIEFAAAPPDARLSGGMIEAGTTSLDQRSPSFVANRQASQLRVVGRVGDPLEIEFAENGAAWVDIPFEEPLRLEAGRSVLVDVRLDLGPGERVAGFEDVSLAALVEGRAGVAPAASLLVSPVSPQARSQWYDSGTTFPGWQPCVLAADASGARIVTEFQSAPADALGVPDASLASSWTRDLGQLPAYRFVRFRLRFDGTTDGASPARVDRIVMPYER